MPTLTHIEFVSDDLLVTLTSVEAETGMGLSEVLTPAPDGGAYLTEALDDTLGISDDLSVQLGWTEIEAGFYITDEAGDREITDTLDDSVEPTDALTVKFPVNRPDDNLGVTDALTVSMHYVRTITDSMGLTEVVQYTGQTDPVIPPEPLGTGGVFLFRPPTVDEGPAGGGRLFGRYKLTRGISILITEGVVVEQRWPDVAQCAAADVVYIGGHDYYMNAADAAVLENAGYAANLTAVDVYLDEYTEVY